MTVGRGGQLPWRSFAGAFAAYLVLAGFFSLPLLVTPCAPAGDVLPLQTPACEVVGKVAIAAAAMTLAVAAAAARLYALGSRRAFHLLFAGSAAPLAVTLAWLLLR